MWTVYSIYLYVERASMGSIGHTAAASAIGRWQLPWHDSSLPGEGDIRMVGSWCWWRPRPHRRRWKQASASRHRVEIASRPGTRGLRVAQVIPRRTVPCPRRAVGTEGFALAQLAARASCGDLRCRLERHQILPAATGDPGCRRTQLLRLLLSALYSARRQRSSGLSHRHRCHQVQPDIRGIVLAAWVHFRVRVPPISHPEPHDVASSSSSSIRGRGRGSCRCCCCCCCCGCSIKR